MTKPKMEILDPVGPSTPVKGSLIEDGFDPSEIDIPQLTEYLRLNKPRAYKTAKYSEELRTLCTTLVASGYSYRQTASATGVSRTSIESWVNDINSDKLALSDLSGQVKDGMADKLFINANRMMVEAMKDEKIAKMSSYQLVGMSKLTIDSAQLLSGGPTANIALAYTKKDSMRNQKGDVDVEVQAAKARLAGLKAQAGGGRSVNGA